MENAYVRSPRDVLEYFGATEVHGLSDSQVEALRLKHGRNGRLHLLLTTIPSICSLLRSHPRRTSYPPMGACPRAIQGSARYHSPGQRRRLIRTRPFRGRGGLDRFRRPCRYPDYPDLERRCWCQPGIICREGHRGLARVQRKHRQGRAQWNNSIYQG
jgi:hypothetical protein